MSGPGGGPGGGRSGAGRGGAGRCGRGRESMGGGARQALREIRLAWSAHKGAAANPRHPRPARARPEPHPSPPPPANSRQPGGRVPPTDTPRRLCQPIAAAWAARPRPRTRPQRPLSTAQDLVASCRGNSSSHLQPPFSTRIPPPPSPAPSKDSCLETLILLRAPHVSSEPPHLLREVPHFLRLSSLLREQPPISSAPSTFHHSTHFS